jgi:archaeosine-15-forming tRNA-guanine transglycosylase
MDFPPVSRKQQQEVVQLLGMQLFTVRPARQLFTLGTTARRLVHPMIALPPQVSAVLTQQEARAFIDAAEARGFEHQGSRGAAFSEVRCRPPR